MVEPHAKETAPFPPILNALTVHTPELIVLTSLCFEKGIFERADHLTPTCDDDHVYGSKILQILRNAK